ISPRFSSSPGTAVSVLIVVVIQLVVSRWLNFGPSERIKHRSIHVGMQRAQNRNLRSVFFSIVKTIVYLGESLAILNHQLLTMRVVFAPEFLELNVLLKRIWKRKRFETIARSISKVVLEGRAKESGPNFVHSTLKHTESRIR